MSWWGLLAMLLIWAMIVSVRRKREAGRRSAQALSSRGAPASSARRPGEDPDIDLEELEQAEREVKDLETDAKGRPLDDVVGDDWGPGTPKPPYI